MDLVISGSYKLSETSIVTKLQLIDGYKFNVKYDVAYTSKFWISSSTVDASIFTTVSNHPNTVHDRLSHS